MKAPLATPGARLALAFLGVLAPVSCGLDPVHDAEVTALGPEQPGVPPGPDHRPGQPCLDCHGGSGPASQQFSAGGTLYEAQSSTVPLNGGTVQLVDATGSAMSATTSGSGNFFIPQSAWSPTFPVHVESISYKSNSTTMHTHIGRNASCAFCHYDPAGPQTPGHIYLVFDVPDGGL